jgi:hypothetical protein
MGGYGSGRSGGRPTVESALRLDIDTLMRRGVIEQGARVVCEMQFSFYDDELDDWTGEELAIDDKILLATSRLATWTSTSTTKPCWMKAHLPRSRGSCGGADTFCNQPRRLGFRPPAALPPWNLAAAYVASSRRRRRTLPLRSAHSAFVSADGSSATLQLGCSENPCAEGSEICKQIKGCKFPFSMVGKQLFSEQHCDMLMASAWGGRHEAGCLVSAG